MADLMKDVKNVLEIEETHVVSWGPQEDPDHVKPTQVHLIFKLKGLPDVRFIMRFKTVIAMDAFLSLMAEYRINVWGNK